MLVLVLFGGFVLSLETAIHLTPRLRDLAIRRGWVDAPDGRRKIHTAPIPNIGGLAIAAGTLVGLLAFVAVQPWLPEGFDALAPPPLIVLGAIIIALVGFWDDLRDLNFRIKLVAQIGVATLVILSGYRIDLFGRVLGEGTLDLAVSVFLTLVWMVGTMNAVNFIDGMDGLAAGSVAIALAGLAGVFLVGGHVEGMILFVAVMGALLGFLRYNWHPASVFMGDSGSLFIGFLLAAYALRGSAHDHPVLQFAIPVVAMGLPILDTGISITRRLWRGQSPFHSDREHLHHRVAELTSHRGAVLLLYVLSAFFALGAVGMAALRAPAAFALFGVGTALVIVFLYQLGSLPGTRVQRSGVGGRRSIMRPPVGGDGASDALPPAASREDVDVAVTEESWSAAS